VPFLACGDLDGWDADASYDLPAEGYVALPPVQPPTAPAYRRAVEVLKAIPAADPQTATAAAAIIAAVTAAADQQDK
jgi:tRNA (cytidine32/guanosine34-2'-O)-methyltransferase